MPKVLHASYSSSGGAGIFATNLVNSINSLKLTDSDYASFISITEKSLRENPFQDVKTTILSSIDEYLLRSRMFPTYFSYFRNNSNNKTLEKILNFDGLIHLHWINGMLNTESLSKIFTLNKKVVWTCHDMEMFTGGCHYSLNCSAYEHDCDECPAVKRIFQKYPKDQLMEKHRRFSNLKNTPKLVFPTNWIHNLFLKTQMSKFFDSEVIENSVNMGFIESSSYLNHNKFLKTGLNIGFVSNWIENPIKNFQTLLKIAQDINDPRLRIIAVGESTKKSDPKKTLGTTFLGKRRSIKDLIDAYEQMDLVVSLSHGESFGLTVAEAAALGIPAITLKGLASAELVDNYVSGFVCDDIDSVKRIIMTLLSDKEILNRMGVEARKKAITKWHPEYNAKCYLKIYENLK